MKVSIVGIGMGNPDTMTLQAAAAVEHAQCLIGAQRLLDAFPKAHAPKVSAVKPQDIVAALLTCGCEHAAVLMSGDVGFHSGASRLRTALAECPSGAFEVENIAGVSSVQYFCALIGESWDDAHLVSLHGHAGSAAAHAAAHAKTFFLTGGENSAEHICQELCENGLETAELWVGEQLSYPQQRVCHGTAAELCGQEFAPLSVVLVKNERPLARRVTHGMPDEAFERGDAPMTKREVRTAAISLMNLEPGFVVWDVGAGTGSVSIELARLLPGGTVYAVEREEAALALLSQNKARFSAHNLRVVAGSAPEALAALPAPDAVFIGGTSGSMEAVLSCILEKNPHARIVATAILLETVGAVLDSFTRRNIADVDVVQLTCARAKRVGKSHMMLGQNPVTILSGGGKRNDG